MHCSHLFCFSPFSLMKYKRKTESPSSAKKKTNIPPNNSQQKKIGFRLIHSGIRPNYFSLSCCCCFFTHQRRMKISFFQWTFLPSRLRQSHEQIIKAERFPFHYSVPLPPSFPIGLGSLDGSFFLKIRQTQAPDVVDDENELVPDQITNEAATQPYLEEPQTLTNNARCRDFFVYLFFVKGKKRTGM